MRAESVQRKIEGGIKAGALKGDEYIENRCVTNFMWPSRWIKTYLKTHHDCSTILARQSFLPLRLFSYACILNVAEFVLNEERTCSQIHVLIVVYYVFHNLLNISLTFLVNVFLENKT